MYPIRCQIVCDSCWIMSHPGVRFGTFESIRHLRPCWKKKLSFRTKLFFFRIGALVETKIRTFELMRRFVCHKFHVSQFRTSSFPAFQPFGSAWFYPEGTVDVGQKYRCQNITDHRNIVGWIEIDLLIWVFDFEDWLTSRLWASATCFNTLKRILATLRNGPFTAIMSEAWP